MAFGSGGASTVVGSHGEVATKLKNKINIFLLYCHCVAHKTNMDVLDKSKVLDCKVISREVDMLLNIIVFSNMSSKHKHALTALQEKLNDVKKI